MINVNGKTYVLVKQTQPEAKQSPCTGCVAFPANRTDLVLCPALGLGCTMQGNDNVFREAACSA